MSEDKLRTDFPALQHEHVQAVLAFAAERERLALVRGAPPKVVILRIGNASTDQIAERMLDAQLQIEAFGVDAAATVLII